MAEAARAGEVWMDGISSFLEKDLILLNCTAKQTNRIV